MRRNPSRLGILVTFSCLFVYGVPPSDCIRAADSLYGTVGSVKSAEVVVLECGGERHELRLVGIDAPKDALHAQQARQFLQDLLLGKNARMRFERRTPDGYLLARLFTDDPVTGIQEVSIELLRAGLARRQTGYDDKYGRLSAAESEARAAGRGLWSAEKAK